MERAGPCLVAVVKCPHASMTTFIKPCSTEPDFAVSPSCARPSPLCSALRIALCLCLCAFTHCRSFYCTHALSHLQLAPESRQISILTLIMPSAEISSVFPFDLCLQRSNPDSVSSYWIFLIHHERLCIQAFAVRVEWLHWKVRTLPRFPQYFPSQITARLIALAWSLRTWIWASESIAQ